MRTPLERELTDLCFKLVLAIIVLLPLAVTGAVHIARILSR